MTVERVAEIVGKLTPLERDLLMGRCEGWGSWMFGAANYMVSLGLGTKREGSIAFDTPLAAQVTDYLLTNDNIKDRQGREGE